MQVIDGRQATRLRELAGDIATVTILSCDEARIDHTFRVAGDLPDHPEQLAEIADTDAQRFFEVLKVFFVLIERGLQPIAPALLCGQCSLGFVQQRTLTVALLLESPLTLLIDLGVTTAVSPHLVEQLVETGSRLVLCNSGCREQTCKGQCGYRFECFHRATSGAETGSRNKSGAACLRAMRKPCVTKFLYSSGSDSHLLFSLFQNPVCSRSGVW